MAVAALALGRVVSGFVPSVSPSDPLVLATAGLLLFAVSLLAADLPADARLAAFLLELSGRMAGAEGALVRLRLAMPRADIANYLRLAPETVSRLFRRFRDESLLVVHGREVEITDRDRLQGISEAGGDA